MTHWTRVPGVWAVLGGFSAPLVAMGLGGGQGRLGASLTSLSLIAAFLGCLFPALGFPFRDQDVVAWLQTELANDWERWATADWRDWLRTALETVLALGLVCRAGAHLAVGAMISDERLSIDYGLTAAPVPELHRQRRNEIRWLVGGVGVTALGSIVAVPNPAVRLLLVAQALVLVSDLVLALDDELGIGAVARLTEAASH